MHSGHILLLMVLKKPPKIVALTKMGCLYHAPTMLILSIYILNRSELFVILKKICSLLRKYLKKYANSQIFDYFNQEAFPA